MLRELLSEDGGISSRRVIGFSSFLIGSIIGLCKAFGIQEIPMELVYAFLGLSSTSLFSISLKNVLNNK
jgi:hypothetical protein